MRLVLSCTDISAKPPNPRIKYHRFYSSENCIVIIPQRSIPRNILCQRNFSTKLSKDGQTPSSLQMPRASFGTESAGCALISL